MPRRSSCALAIRDLESVLAARRQSATSRFLLDDEDTFEDEIDEYLQIQLDQILATRYFARPSAYRRREDHWQSYLYDWTVLNDEEFLGHFRVSRTAFRRIVDLICHDEVFQEGRSRTFRGPAELHLMVLLKFLGTSGNDNTSSKLAQFFGFGKGSTNNYVERAVTAILKLQDSVITWPDEEERKMIAARIQAEYSFPNCVGMTDGTLFPLESKPESNGEEYYTRKGSYAINGLLTCDDAARIRHIVVGWPGSVHDNRVWTTSDLVRTPDKFFSKNEYLLGDSAFQASANMVPAFKKPPKANMSLNTKYFNTKLAKPRVKSEHCIGLVKMRFQYLRAIRVALKNRRDMRRIIRYILCSCMLHNLLISEPISKAWKTQMTREGLIGNGLSDGDELNMPLDVDAGGGERRAQLMSYLLELRG